MSSHSDQTPCVISGSFMSSGSGSGDLLTPSRFEKLRQLGRGSFGEAWLARSKASQRLYVIKELILIKASNKQVNIESS